MESGGFQTLFEWKAPVWTNILIIMNISTAGEARWAM